MAIYFIYETNNTPFYVARSQKNFYFLLGTPVFRETFINEMTCEICLHIEEGFEDVAYLINERSKFLGK